MAKKKNQGNKNELLDELNSSNIDPVEETDQNDPVEETDQNDPVEEFDTSKFVDKVEIPDSIDHVFVTSDGQVFLPINGELAKKHASRKKLEIYTHKM